MFLANIIKKGFGFFREMILAFLFGSSIIYANFLLLKTVTDLFSQLTQGNALQTNLLSKFSKIYNKESLVSLEKVFSSSKKMALYLFLISQIIQLPIVWYLSPEDYLLFIGLSVILGGIMSVSFYSSIFLVVMQAKGDFKTNSIATTLEMFITTFFLYPLSKFFGVFGIVISKVIGLFTMFFIYIKPMVKEVNGMPISLGVKDFNISILFLGNFSHIIILIARFVAGLDDGNNITFFNYSIVLLNVVLTAVILNLNTIVLRRLAIKKEMRLIFFSVFSALLLGLGLVFVINVYGFDIIQFVFERGAFTESDTLATFFYVKDLSISFIFIFIASALFQPFFSLDQKLIQNESRVMALILITTVALLFILFQFSSTTARENSIIMIYTLSVLSMLLSAFSSYKYFTTKTV
jgi:peptidoglycan biosynthesis protein MviN/MurJ (putative lipid II flippase)